MSLPLRQRPRHAGPSEGDHASSFFVDALDAPTAPADAAPPAARWLLVAIALATLAGVAGLFGLPQLLQR